MRKWIKWLLAAAIIAFLFWYLYRHWEQLRFLLRLKPVELFIIYLLSFLGTLNSAWTDRYLLKAMKTKTGFWDMYILESATPLLNYVPMKFGTIFKANYLKHRYGLSYACFATFFMYLTFLMLIATSLTGLTILYYVYGLVSYEHKILAALFFIISSASLLFILIPIPVPKGSGRLTTTIKIFLTGRKEVSRNIKVIIVCTICLGINFFLSAVRLGIIYHSMGKDIHPGGYLILGSLAYATRFVSITPGDLGLRELVIGSGATVLGVPLEIGIFAAVIDRAIMLSWVFAEGGICALWLWHKYPSEFKKKANKSPAEI